MTQPLAAEVPFKMGDVIKDAYTLQLQIGAGTYGVIFSALFKSGDLTKHVAIKLEKNIAQFSLQANEVLIMKSLVESQHYAKFYQCGSCDQYKFVVMELLGPSLIKLVNRKRPYQLSTLQLLKFGQQSIQTLQELHRAGFVHRDVKPDNFVIGNSLESAGIIYLIDFGLCKKLFIHDGKITKPTRKGSFRGTLRYASPNAHNKIELGRQDDLISLLYMMIEFYTGKLPWQGITDPV
ncbi:MAG: putative CK1/TTBK protein kinase [Streblomastix strix]|uniref:non-specific serine/threonine protein kinase n=1 Tax=Streblomastix strix TaxID=222440 RepID=A0A5J4V4M7_9EUKA|nr:MAG: putative CK1/TTBK protein kinase [Streblomastix strix]